MHLIQVDTKGCTHLPRQQYMKPSKGSPFVACPLFQHSRLTLNIHNLRMLWPLLTIILLQARILNVWSTNMYSII